jgi:hypothetical protein
MTHPSDDLLAACLDDDSGADSADSTADHLRSCPACQARLTELRLVAGMLRTGPRASVVEDVVRRLQEPSWTALVRGPLLAASSCAALLLVLTVGGPPSTSSATPDAAGTFSARGPAPHTSLLLTGDGDVVVEGDVVGATTRWRADLLHPSGTAGIAVIAIDARGDVHWLRPAWVDSARPPPCPGPSPARERSIAAEMVAFDLPAGPLTVRALSLPTPCDVRTLDKAWSARSAQTLGGAVVEDELQLVVQP